MGEKLYLAPGGPEHIILNLEVQGGSSMNRVTRRMAQVELAAMEQHSRLAMFSSKTGISSCSPRTSAKTTRTAVKSSRA